MKNKNMKIKKLETRIPYLCTINGHEYVRTSIDWNDERPLTISWHLNEDQKDGETYLSEDKLEELFWEFNSKPNEIHRQTNIRNLNAIPGDKKFDFQKAYEKHEEKKENIFYENYVNIVKANSEEYGKWMKMVDNKITNESHFEPYSESTFEMLMAKDSEFRKLFENITTKNGNNVYGKDVPINDFFYSKIDCYVLTDRSTDGNLFVTLNREYADAIEHSGNYLLEIGNFIEDKEEFVKKQKSIAFQNLTKKEINPLTVSQLTEKLKKFDSDLEVWVTGLPGRIQSKSIEDYVVEVGKDKGKKIVIIDGYRMDEL